MTEEKNKGRKLTKGWTVEEERMVGSERRTVKDPMAAEEQRPTPNLLPTHTIIFFFFFFVNNCMSYYL